MKAEFEKFGGLLEKAQKISKLANNQLEEVMGKRTRAIQRQLRSVEALPAKEEQNPLLDHFQKRTRHKNNQDFHLKEMKHDLLDSFRSFY